jgi:hypothetical protein
MISAWTKNLSSQDETERFKRHLLSSRPILERLQELLDEEKRGIDAADISPKIFDLPNWDYRQAYGNGFRAALSMVGALIYIDPKEYNGRQPIQ